MHINEPRTNPTLKNHVMKEYELEQGLLGLIGQYWLPKNPILNLIQHSITESQMHSSSLNILQQDTNCLDM